MSGWLAHCALAKGAQSTQWEIKQIPSVWWKQLNHLHILTFLRFDLFSRILPGFQNLWCLSVIHLPLASVFYPSLSSHYILNYSFNTYFSLPLWLLLQPGELTVTGATTTRPGESAESTRGTATEREATTAEREARVTTTPASEPKKNIIPPPLFSSAASCSLPVSLSSPFPQTVRHNNSPKLSDQAASLRPCPALHCPTLSSPSQPVS